MNQAAEMVNTHYAQKIFEEMGIESIHWVDDKFNENNTSSHQEQECIDTILSLYEQQNFEKIKGLIEEVFKVEELENLPDMPVAEIKSYFKEKISNHNIQSVVSFLDVKQDLDDDHFAAMKGVLTSSAKKLETYTWHAWNASKVGLEDLKNSFFIIDHEYSDENEVVGTGADIIEALTKKMDVSSYCFLLTHAVAAGDEENALRDEIIKSKSLDEDAQVKFSVISKKILKDKDKSAVDYALGEIAKSVYFRRSNVTIFDQIKSEIEVQLNALRSDLCQSSAFEIEKVIFKSSKTEGSSELDLLRRFIAIKNDQALNGVIKNGLLDEHIKKIRSIQTIQIEGEIPTTLNTGSISRFIDYRNTELFDEFVNQVNSPLASGDIFEFSVADGESTSKFILAGQECELMLRENGKRRAEEVMLIPFIEKTGDVSTIGKAEKFYKASDLGKYEVALPMRNNEGCKLQFDLARAITAAPKILDLCVFNKCGSIKIDLESDANFFPSLSGLTQLFQNLKAELNKSAEDKKVPMFTLGPNQPKWFDDKIFGIDGQRIKRLRSPYINELLHKYFAYKSRIAFEHDFSRAR